ncbi:hypothetical protein BTUL_0141g00330 [Botrytis tulipae]|uniref:Uncharacterized protein n=1 Tax=Botrytis tulipae TaxID=87230 RepID=A0A4Z1EI70_9HELO|nr:hypothetical protein BTUL_0141g00330 [Botrytis tulipae]
MWRIQYISAKKTNKFGSCGLSHWLSNVMRLGDSSNTVASNHQVRQNAYFETCQQPEQEHEQIEYEHNEAFMYDYASQFPSPIQTCPAYAMPYPHYPSWCV